MSTMKDIGRAAASLLLSACVWVFAGAVSPSQAEPWPQRPVKFILPLGPGAGVDVTARLVADRLAKRWDQPVVVENRPGGDGMVAITAFIGAHDNHTLLFSPAGSFTAHPYLHEKLPYDPRELAPIARVTNTLVAFGVPESLKVATLTDLIAMARAQPGKLNWASATGTNEFLFAGFLKTAGLSMQRVPYRDTVQALNDLAEGRIDMYVAALAIMLPQVRAGKVSLAITNRTRAATMPDVPTAREAGYPELAFEGLVGLFGPRDVANDVRERIAVDVRVVVADPDIVARLTAAGQAVNPGSSAEFEAEMKEQHAQVAAVGQALGIKPAAQ
ncbi:MAG: Bug family tripartite tricarboxylate transporter substrate binding protein [Rhodoplanes sp.]